MGNRMDIVVPRTNGDKTYFTKIGSAWETKNGGWSLSFDALPTSSLNDKGQLETRALLMPPRDKQDAQPPRGGRTTSRDDLDDAVPFVALGMDVREPGASRRMM